VGYFNYILSLVWSQTTTYTLLKLSLEYSLLVKHLYIIHEILLVCVQSELDTVQAWRTTLQFDTGLEPAWGCHALSSTVFSLSLFIHLALLARHWSGTWSFSSWI